MGGNKYTKADIVDRIYQKTGLNRKDIREVIDMFIEELKEALKQRVVIELRGLGTFETRERKGRKVARNPKTGETLSVNAHCIAAFRPGRELKKAVWALPSGEGPPASKPTGDA